MTERRILQLSNEQARRLAVNAVLAAPDGAVCEIRPQTRSLDQNARLHAMFVDIARQVEFFGEKRDLWYSCAGAYPNHVPGQTRHIRHAQYLL